MATHTIEQVDIAINKIAKCARKLGVIKLAEVYNS
jgi:hypothetical protein